MTRDELKNYLLEAFGSKMTPLESGRYDLLMEIKPADLVEVCKRLRDDQKLGFDFVSNIGAIDTGEEFQAVYNLVSYAQKHRLDLKMTLDRKNPTVDSVIEIWPAADWYEREMWELYGFSINNHPDLKPLLLPENWDQGWPMRKDWDAPDFIRMPEL